MLSAPNEPLQPAVTDQQIQDFLALDGFDPVATALAVAATGSAVNYLQRELVTRERTVTYQDWPFTGSKSIGISPSCVEYDGRIELPYAAPLDAVMSVKVYGDSQLEYTATKTQPAAVELDRLPQDGSDQPAIEVVYKAGYGAQADVPEVIQSAILMMTACMYEHRGACSADNAMRESGAAIMLQPYRANAVAL